MTKSLIRAKSSSGGRSCSSSRCLLVGLTVVVILFQIFGSLSDIETILTSAGDVATTASGMVAAITSGNGLTQDPDDQQQLPETPIPPRTVSFLNQHPLCQRLTLNDNNKDTTNKSNATATSATSDHHQAIPNAGNWWLSHWESILEASYFPSAEALGDSVKQQFRRLLLGVGPSQLEQALLTQPRHDQLERIYSILEARRRRFLDPATNSSTSTAPPLRVMVMGGSVTEGVECEQQTVNGLLIGRNCSWPVRLESFLNTFLGYDAVRVVNVAQGGTNSDQALSVIKYWMYPTIKDDDDSSDASDGKQKMFVPDIIVHAFGSNDSHLGNIEATERERIKLLHEQGTKRLNHFVQTVQRAHACPTPVLVHLDDYFGGHDQGALIGDFTYRMVLKEVAGWYGNLAVSSAQVVDDFIYPDTKGEVTFSPRYRLSQNGHYVEEVHFGYAGHVAILWSWVYGAVQATFHFCNSQDWDDQQHDKSKVTDGPMTSAEPSIVRPNVNHLRTVVPPPLDYKLSLHNVTDAWQREKERQEQHCETISQIPPCALAWVAGPEGPTNIRAKLRAYLSPFVTVKRGWDYERDMSHGWARKLGLVAKGLGSNIQFEFTNTKGAPLQILTIHFLKSYGEKWEGSAAEFVIQKRSATADTNVTDNERWTMVKKETVLGFHNSTSSISYTAAIHFPPIPTGNDVQVAIKLVGGSTFKITGMMLCSR